MGKIRILVVDDSVVIRRMVTDALAADPALEVVGAAANGRIALSKIPQVNPDLITLDIEMPEMDGLEALRQLRKTYPRLPVIMFSTLTERGAAATLDALAYGANDYVTKPSNVGSASAALERIREQLIPKIKAQCPLVSPPSLSPATARPGPAAAPKVWPKLDTRGREAPAEIVAIGVSTGGPNALAEVIPQLPANLPVPVVIVQHMPPIFTKLLAERLSSKSQIRVEEGRPGEILEPGQAWLAPGDFHMAVARSATGVHLITHREPPENSCRPAVDVLFRSVAEAYGPRALGVVMTGMGQDGLRGSERIREAGGRVLAQDEATSVVWGMPGFVAQAGLAEKVLPLHQIAAGIVLRVSESRGAGSRSPSFRASEAVSPSHADQRR
jgi:two-component system, chemotaxis family, protein-glutamate methylesterase/glutaminase